MVANSQPNILAIKVLLALVGTTVRPQVHCFSAASSWGKVGHVTMDDPANRERTHHDTHAIPPQAICNIYKRYQKMSDATVETDLDVVDFTRGLTTSQKEKIFRADVVPKELIRKAYRAFKCAEVNGGEDMGEQTTGSLEEEMEECIIYEHKDFPGLRILPSLLPPECQLLVLDAVMHRDLVNPLHKTNLHADYNIPSPILPSFFTNHPSSRLSNQTLTPLNPHSTHKPLNPTQFLSKKLRWLTLGSQYDWSTRAYPTVSPTPFPQDIAALVRTLFRSSFEPESGVVLLYSAKDYMPVHRDVSEMCERGLASFSLGCDGLFVLSREKEGQEAKKEADREMEVCVLRVRSGDCVWMGGETRWCWHAMPKIMSGTCPQWLQSWPAAKHASATGDVQEDKEREKMYERWSGYMKGKRVNLSCRQVWG